MKRFGQTIYLRPEHEAEYRRLHARIWPEIEQGIRASGISNYSIFLKDGVMFAYYEYTGPDEEFEQRMKAMADAPRMQEWWALTSAMQRPLDHRADGEWWADMESVFYQA